MVWPQRWKIIVSPERFAEAISVPLPLPAMPWQSTLALRFFPLAAATIALFWEQDYLRLAQASQLRLSQSELEAMRMPFERIQGKLLFG